MGIVFQRNYKSTANEVIGFYYVRTVRVAISVLLHYTIKSFTLCLIREINYYSVNLQFRLEIESVSEKERATRPMDHKIPHEV